MTKKKKTNILKKIILTLTACFIAVFSVFTLVDIPKETKQVSAATIADGDIVYTSPNIPIVWSLFPLDYSSYDSSTIVSGINFYTGYINHKFTYQLGSTATFSFNNFIFYSGSYSIFYSAGTTPSIQGDVSVDGTSLTFNPLYNFSYKNVFKKSIFGSTNSSFDFIFVNVSYNYNPDIPFSFDVLDIAINPRPSMYGDYPSPPYSSIVYEYHSIRGNTSRLTIEYSFYNNQSLQGNDTLQRYYLNPNYESTGGGSSDPNAYQNGYDNGYARGYIEGELSAQDSFFDRGYNEGYDSGKADGYLEGEQAGISQGNTSGYLRGKNDGYREGKEAALNSSDLYSFTSLITSVIDVPINSFRSLFNFELLGVNLSGFFLGLLTCCIVITVIRMII